MSSDSRKRHQRRQQQPPPVAAAAQAAFASLSDGLQHARSLLLRPSSVAPTTTSASTTLAASAHRKAAPVAAAAARAALKGPASSLPGGEKMAVDLARAAALLVGALAHHASRAAEAAAGAIDKGGRGNGRRRRDERGGDASASASRPADDGGDTASSNLPGVAPPSSRAVALLLAEGAERERALDVRGAIAKYEAAIARSAVDGGSREGGVSGGSSPASRLDARALGAASKAWSDASYLDELGVEALTDEDKRRLNARAVERCRDAAEAAPLSGLPHVACCVSLGRMALWTPDSRGKAKLAAAAREQASLATLKSPDSDLAHHLLGRWHWEMAGLPRVVRAIAKIAFGATLPPGTYEDAAACYARAAALAPTRLIHRVELGRSLAKAGRYGEAVEQLEAALSMDVEDVNAHLQRADAEIMLASLRYDDGSGGEVSPNSRYPSGYSSAATRAKAWQGSLAPECLAAASLAAGVRDARKRAEDAAAASASASADASFSSTSRLNGIGAIGEALRAFGLPPPTPAAFGIRGGGANPSPPPAEPHGRRPRRRRRQEREPREEGARPWWQPPLGFGQRERQQSQQQPRRQNHHHRHRHGGGGDQKQVPT